MKKKIFSLFIVFAIMICLTACGGKEGSSSANKSIDASDLSIKDFKWDTKESKCNGYDCYVVSLRNKSDYDIIGFEFTYKVKDNVSNDDLLLYSDFMNDHDGYIEEDDSPKYVTLSGNVNQLIKKDEKNSEVTLKIGYKKWVWYDYPTKEQFNLMEPKEMQVGLVYNNKVYVAYYDFVEESWKLDNNVIVADEWTDKAIGKLIDKPECDHYVVRKDKDDKFYIIAYGVTESMYKDYVEKIKKSGFEEDGNYSSKFKGKNDDGYEVTVDLIKSDKRMTVEIEKD